jgi:hypothetical protein
MFERERYISSETMIPGPLLAIRKPSFILFVVYFSFFLKIKKYLLIILFCKLASCECLTTTLASWGRKIFVYSCKLLEESRKENHYLPREFDINPRFTLVGKTYLAASLCAWSSNKWHFEE